MLIVTIEKKSIEPYISEKILSYFFVRDCNFQSLIKDRLVSTKSHLSTCNFSGLMNAICQNDMQQ
jgi:hypothetical protein